MAAKKGEKNPVRLINGVARVEFIAVFDEVQNRFIAGYGAATVYRELLAAGKITMKLRTFQKLFEKHLKAKKDKNKPEIPPLIPEKKPAPTPKPPGKAQSADGEEKIDMKRPRINRYEDD